MRDGGCGHRRAARVVNRFGADDHGMQARQRIPATGISGVTGLVSIVGGLVLGVVRAGWWWAIGFAVLVFTVGLALEYRRSRRATGRSDLIAAS